MKRQGFFRRKILPGLVIAIALFLLMRLYYAVTDDFRISNIKHDMPYEIAWTLPATTPSEETHLQQILNQPFHYLGKGAQSYAFASEDGRYVIKFFKFKHLRPSKFLEWIPSIGFLKTYKDKQAARKERKLFGVFRAYKLAYEIDRLESGLIFIQLNAAGNPSRHVTLIDKIRWRRTLDLADVPFILQDKGRTFRVVLDELLQKDDLATAKERIGQILDMYSSEYRKGIYDHDHGVMQNTGFIGERPIHLDVGKLVKEESMRQRENAKKDALLVSEKIKYWIQKKHPDHLAETTHFIHQKLVQLYD